MYTRKIIAFAIFLTLFTPIFSAFADQKAALYLSQPKASYSPGQQVIVSVYINPNGLTYDSANVHINFPTDILEAKSFTLNPAFSFSAPDNGIDATSGIISYGAGIPGGSTALQLFGTATFTVKKEGSGVIAINPDSLVINSGENIFSGTQSTITIAAAKAPVATPAPVVKKEVVSTKNDATLAPDSTPTPPLTQNPEPTLSSSNAAALSIPVVDQKETNQLSLPYILSNIWIWLAIIGASLISLLYLTTRKHHAKKESL